MCYFSIIVSVGTQRVKLMEFQSILGEKKEETIRICSQIKLILVNDYVRNEKNMRKIEFEKLLYIFKLLVGF